MTEILIDVLRNSVLITGLVLIMMLMIEYCNIESHGSLFAKLRSSSLNQVIAGTLLGLIPGCIGGFAAVSLFTHRLISFGALTAMMIASSGDEAFVLLATMPLEALLLFGILAVIAIAVGLLADKFFFKKTNLELCPEEYEIHKKHDSTVASPFRLASYREALRWPSKERILLLVGISLFVVAVVTGFAGHDHDHSAGADDHHHEIECTEGCHHHNHAHQSTFALKLLDEHWMNMLFAFMSVVTIFLTATAKEHFIKEHLWNHVIKRHLLSIFLWTAGGLLVCHLGIRYLHIEEWIGGNMIVVILIAVAVGIIPESGPHLVFVTLYLNGIVPFSVLLANSISQDGHTTLPLLASSRRTFLLAKLVNVAVGTAIGITVYLLGF